ncbi:uncharacterized membrane protein At1g16860-like [Nymphaea colorata]|nr:uncharacterized membrane protein At1g16860-like [Nymphaea colorata]
MNDLSWRGRDGREASFWSTIPRAATCTLLFLFALGVSVFAFVLFAVHNALFLLILLALSALLLALLFWNAWNWRHRALSFFLSRLPDSALATAAEGHFVKVTGVATCGSVALESSYEKAARCVYTSTSLYEYGGLASLFNGGWSIWRLAYSERFVTDFYITDRISGLRATVRAGFGSKVLPLIDENVLVNTKSKSQPLSPYLKSWLAERNLEDGACLLCLEEGYIEEGKRVCVMGVLKRSEDGIAIVEPPESVPTGCQWGRLLFPLEIDGLILSST